MSNIDTFPGSAFHPSNANPVVSGPPSQDTVNESGDDIHGVAAGYVGGGNNGHAATTNLPHPASTASGTAPLQVSYDPLDLLNAIAAVAETLSRAAKRVSLADDEAIKRRMRGPLKGTSIIDADGVGTITLGPVPSGEIWLVDRYVVLSDSEDTTACRVYDGGIYPDSEIDFTYSGNEAVSDNVQPVVMYPNTYLTFQWTSGTEDANVWARVNYRSIAENLQFAHADKDDSR